MRVGGENAAADPLADMSDPFPEVYDARDGGGRANDGGGLLESPLLAGFAVAVEELFCD
jgi:hypothetical protein